MTVLVTSPHRASRRVDGATFLLTKAQQLGSVPNYVTLTCTHARACECVYGYTSRLFACQADTSFFGFAVECYINAM